MDLITILVVIALTALSFGALVGLEIYSRKKHRDESADSADLGKKRNDRPLEEVRERI